MIYGKQGQQSVKLHVISKITVDFINDLEGFCQLLMPQCRQQSTLNGY